MSRFVLITLWITACTSAKEDTGATGDGSGVSDEPLECQIIFYDEEEYDAEKWDCALDTLCEYVRYDAGERAFRSREAAECLLQAFAERRIGKLTLGHQGSDITSFGSETLYILDTLGHVATNKVGQQDMVTDYYVRRPYRLKAASYFEDCLAADSDEAMAECLFAWRDGDCVELETTCDGGF